MGMRNNGHSEKCICAACKALLHGDVDAALKQTKENAEKEVMVFGQFKSFRKTVDAFIRLFKPVEAFIYEKFCVMEFKWTADAEKMEDYLDSRSAARYTGLYYDRDTYLMVLMNVADEEAAA